MNVPEVTRECIFTRDKNGDFSRRVIDTLFRLATLHWSRIFAFMRGATYLQPTVKAPSSYMYYQWFGNSVPGGGGGGGGRGRSSCSTWSRCESVYGHITIFCVSLGCLLPSVCPLAVCYPLCAPWLSVTLCVPLGCLLPSVCPLAVCCPLCAPWLSVALCVPLGCLLPSVCPLAVCYPYCGCQLEIGFVQCGCPLDNFSSIIFHENSCRTYMYHHMPYISLASFLGSCITTCHTYH